MPRPYNRSKSFTFLWVFLVLAATAASTGIGMLFPKDSMGAWSILVFCLPLLLALALGWAIVARFNRARLATIKDALEGEEFVVTVDPSVEDKHDFYRPIKHLTGWAALIDGGSQIQWFANKRSEVKVFEHEYLAGSGDTSQLLQHTVVCFPFDVADRGGGLIITRPVFGEKLTLAKSALDVNLDDGKFAKEWIVHGNPELAIGLLNKNVRQKLSNSPRGESWQIGAGWACCTYAGTFDAENLRNFIRRSFDIVEALRRPV